MLISYLFALALFAAAAGIELPPLIKKKQWRELAAYSFLLLLGLFIITLYKVYEIDFTSVSSWFVQVFSWQ